MDANALGMSLLLSSAGCSMYVAQHDVDEHHSHQFNWCICIDVDFAKFGTCCDYVRRFQKCIIFVHTANTPCQSYSKDSFPSMSSDEDLNAP
jgi:hypothetical protein